MRKYGTRNEVWNDEAKMTRGQLTKDDLIMSSSGRLVSKRKSEAAKKNYEKYGFNKRQEPEEEKPEVKPKKKRRRKKKVVKQESDE